MSHFSRCASMLGAPLAIAALLGFVTPAGARLASNGVSLNRLASNGTSAQGISPTAVAQNPANARITTGSALADLNGVAVETVILLDATNR